MTFGVSRSDLGRSPVWRPSFLPRAFAAASPGFTRLLIRSRSVGHLGEIEAHRALQDEQAS